MAFMFRLLAGATIVIILSIAWGTAGSAHAEEVVLKNKDVIKMSQAGLDTAVIIAKIESSAVDFDVSVQGLKSLQDAPVHSDIVVAMIARPSGPLRSDNGRVNQTSVRLNPEVHTIEEVEIVLIEAPTEVLRSNAEEILLDSGGPKIWTGDGMYDAKLIVGADCGDQRFSWWTGANYATCTGSLTLQSGGNRLWSTTDHERSANGAKASRKMTKRMVRRFLDQWAGSAN